MRNFSFFPAQQYFYCFILLYVNVIIKTINDLLVHVLTCIGHFQVLGKRNKILVLIFDILVGMYKHSIFHSCSVITVTTNIYIFDIIRLPVSAL
jgi:hypothetical protein